MEPAVALRILVVDDDLNVARALCRRLRGHHLEVAGSGAEAVVLCQRNDYDLILCDVMMPNLSGAGVHQRLSALRPEVVPRIVFVTGGVFTAEVTAFMAGVANRVLEKPVDRETLAAVIAAVQPVPDPAR
ncbi:MAG TPA: response regulator [Kofleriaceae bacterium]|nr:response regulator [Kofleriaceae bacterium]